MSCCNNNQGPNGHENGHKGHSRHMLLMILCCAIPVVLLLLLPFLGINNPLIRSILSFGMLLICPLMHIMMIPLLFRKDKGKKSDEQEAYMKEIADK